MKAICIFLAEGFEEMEAMFPLDINLNSKYSDTYWTASKCQEKKKTCGIMSILRA